MSNIFTEFARLYLRPGASLDAPAVESLVERMMGDRGSYQVPEWHSLSPEGWLDVQYGSGKGAGFTFIRAEDLAAFDRVWVRFCDEGGGCDDIRGWDLSVEPSGPIIRTGERRSCRYRFDEVRVVARDAATAATRLPDFRWVETADGWRLPCDGSYIAMNMRQYPHRYPESARLPGLGERGLATPTTRCVAPTDMGDLAPTELASLVEEGDPSLLRVDLYCAGRVVQRGFWDERWDGPDWSHYCADDWDNCADEDFLRDLRRARPSSSLTGS